jgi:hypothetical protein
VKNTPRLAGLLSVPAVDCLRCPPPVLPAPPAAAYLGGLLQAISRLAGAAVEHQLGDADVPHRVAELLLSLQAGRQWRQQRRRSE